MKISFKSSELIPYGLVVTRAWLKSQGLDRHTLDNWLKSNQVVSLVRGVYTRADTKKFTWQTIVYSLQRMNIAVTVGGLTALELQGFGHYISLSQEKTIQLYSFDSLPAWVNKILPNTKFIQHNGRLFGAKSLKKDFYDLQDNNDYDGNHLKDMVMSWGGDELPLVVSTPERAFFELLLDVPKYISLEHANQLMEGMTNLSPRRVNELMKCCTKFKVKRLFLWLAEKHKHVWLKKIELNNFTMESGILGSGKRAVVKGGKLDHKYLITVPEDLYGS